MNGYVAGLVAVLILVFIVSVWRRQGPHRTKSARRAGWTRGSSVGPGAAGAFYELLDAQKRAAVEIIVEERAAYRDPEDRDGTLNSKGERKDDAGSAAEQRRDTPSSSQ